MDLDQVFVPKTRSQVGLPPIDLEHENLLGSRVSDEVSKELYEALGDSPIGALLGSASYLVRYFSFYSVRYY
jgi:omega-6 fatty acid desaturase (delta-12 desaturase)